jgi:hypothetical protein
LRKLLPRHALCHKLQKFNAVRAYIHRPPACQEQSRKSAANTGKRIRISHHALVFLYNSREPQEQKCPSNPSLPS